MQRGNEALNLRWLDHFPDLAKITDAAWLEAVRASSVRVIPPGTVLFQPGNPCSGFMLVLAGAVRVVLPGENGRGVLLYRVGPRETCVLMLADLLGDIACSTEGVAETTSHLVVIPPHHFDHALTASPAFRRFVFSIIGQCMAKVILLLEEITFKRLDIRLAQLLVRGTRGNGPPRLHKTHQEIATELGSRREVISRMLKEFEHNNWVRLDRGAIEVLSRIELERFASAK